MKVELLHIPVQIKLPQCLSREEWWALESVLTYSTSRSSSKHSTWCKHHCRIESGNFASPKQLDLTHGTHFLFYLLLRLINMTVSLVLGMYIFRLNYSEIIRQHWEILSIFYPKDKVRGIINYSGEKLRSKALHMAFMVWSQFTNPTSSSHYFQSTEVRKPSCEV